MVFNSVTFVLFFPTVVALYFALPPRWRWALLLIASCLFYMAFIPVYILILAGIIIVDYAAGIWIHTAQGHRRRVALGTSIFVNVGVLAVFKYYNFAASNLNDLAAAMRWHYSLAALKMALPIGLSFHTFQAMSYTIEVYRGRQQPERHLGIYALYVMFFPQLVAGPIERPQNLLPQLHEAKVYGYDDFTNGLKLMMWGYFKKLVIADRLAPVVNDVYGNWRQHNAISIAIATIFFSYEIYCDFSGYTDIARGAAQVLGFRLMVNFRHPYGAQSIGEFWHRWHISLSTWFRDYVYIPLGGSRVRPAIHYRNLLAVFVLSGLWHGANWTFMVWGAIHGCYLVTSQATRVFRERVANILTPVLQAAYAPLRTLFTFLLVTFAWIFFRAADMTSAVTIAEIFPRGLAGLLATLTSFTKLQHALAVAGADITIWIAIVSVIVMEIVESMNSRYSIRARLAVQRPWVRWASYYALVFWVVVFGKLEAEPFIYFQF